MSAVLTLHDLTVTRGARPVLDHVDLQVAPGRRIGLVGPNGVGKSTLLAAIIRLLDHNAEIDVSGVVVNLFQSRANLPRRLVEELRAEGMPLLEPFITTSVKMRESHQAHRPLIDLAPRHKLSLQFQELYDTLESRQLAAAS